MGFNSYPAKGGIPSGNTAGRPSSPVIGDTYYNGEAEILEIYNGTQWVANSAPPATPSILSVTDVGTNLPYANGGTLTVVVAPGSGGATPLLYSALTTPSSFTASSSTTTISLTGLTPGTTFQVSANARNNFGTTVNSPLFNAVTATTLPQTPTVVATPSSTSISYAMTGSNGGKAITNYEISTDGVTYTALSPAQTGPVVITGLTEGVSYTRYFKAVNANGVSLATSAVTASTPIGIDYVVVGGGAGATGYYYTGGAGSGSMLTGTLTGAVSVAYPIKVGAGGAQQNGPGGDGNPGTSSIFATITAPGGKGAAASAPLTTYLGGTQANSSAGGGSGGHASFSGDTAGGGGGNGAAGGNGASNAKAGDGGTGTATAISGSSVTYAGGGGGSAYATYGRGSGGAGGGGAGCKGTDGPLVGVAGGTNTGGGGGGASHPANGAQYGYGYAGGSGIVILKISNTRTANFTAGVTSSLSTAVSGFKVYTITAAGTGDTVTLS